MNNSTNRLAISLPSKQNNLSQRIVIPTRRQLQSCEKRKLARRRSKRTTSASRRSFAGATVFDSMDVPDSVLLRDMEPDIVRLRRLVADGMKEMPSASRRRAMVPDLTHRGQSRHKVCRCRGLSRCVTGYALQQSAKDWGLSERLLATSPQVPRLGCRRMAAWLSAVEAWVQLLWRSLGLNIPRRRRHRRRNGNDIC